MIAQAEYEHFPLIWPKVAGPQAPSNRTNATAPALIDNSASIPTSKQTSGQKENNPFEPIIH